jgi:hypothetical protein
VQTVMKFRGPCEVKSFVISRLIIDISRPTLFRGVGFVNSHISLDEPENASVRTVGLGIWI